MRVGGVETRPRAIAAAGGDNERVGRQDTRWREQMEMRAALARAKVEEELRELKRNLGGGGGGR